ncbi:ATP-binding protein [Massilia sp. R2A-15]|uniref:HAMP domain-containing sensor histidine kinase n=1 Tax=Massilia sp. R2A-15 TaxID=3064278 RepID=UPI00273240A7|nr:ATP-binding protein [Massilia sp. R2A-15]WLI90849.1 ATP-binding protein [Massilia sp. R2A-15]
MGRLFWKFFACILLAQLATTIGVGTVFWLRDQARMQQAAAMPRAIDMGPSAEFMIDAAAATLAHGGSAALRDLVASEARNSIFVIDAEGRDMLGRDVPPEARAQAEKVLEDGTPRHRVVRTLTAPDGARYLVFVRSMRGRGPGGHGGPHGPGGPGGPPGKGFPFMSIAGATVASLLFAGLLAWYFSRPIRALRSAFEAASAGDLSPRFDAPRRVRDDELDDLGRDFDSMAGRLRSLMEGQRRLLHDVSHELRSPLARLQAAIGLAQQQPDKICASLERIERESVRMDKLVGELLTLSRLEVSAAMPPMEEVGLMELVEDIVADARFEAGQQGRSIEVKGMALVGVRCAPDLLSRAIENVVRNAIKHSPEGGTVCIELGADIGQARISVLDRGPGVAPEQLASIFEPFYRAQDDGGVDGHGLGLAIARRVIGAHGGAISASNREGGGLRVDITLPLAGAV